MTLAHAILLCAVLAPLALVRSALADTPPRVEVAAGRAVARGVGRGPFLTDVLATAARQELGLLPG